MKGLFKFLAVSAGVLLLSAFLAPILHDFLPFKFGRIFNRLVMIFTLAAIILFVRVKRSDLENSGLVGRKDNLYLFNFCFVAGFLILLLLMEVKVLLGHAAWKWAAVGAPDWILAIVRVFFTALLIGFIEETFFRGFIFAKLQKAFQNLWVSIGITSLFYSLIHFISDKKPFIGPDPTFRDSFRLMGAPLQSLMQVQSYWDEAVGLFIFGVVLNLLYLRTRSLYACVGLHAGCVFFVKMDGFFAESFNTSPLLWSSAKMYDGIAGWICLFILFFVFNKFLECKNEKK